MIILLLNFIFSFVTALLFFPRLIKYFNSKRLLDKPDSRKLHTRPKPSMGGILFLPISLIGLYLFSKDDFLISENLYLVFASILVVFLGFWDDRVNLRARYKLLFFLPAIFLIIYGVEIRLTSFHGLFGVYEINTLLGSFLTLFTIISITNAFNLIDGVDGLAGSIGVTICVILGVLLYQQGSWFHALLLFGVAGVTLAFLIFNWNPSKIFMGDTGSLLLGFLITVSIIKFIEGNHMSNKYFYIENPISFGIALIIVPFFDTIRVFTIRVLHGRSPFDPDRNHLHHLLLKLGFNHAVTSMILLLSTWVFVSFALMFNSWSDNSFIYWILLLGASMCFFLHYFAKSKSYAKKREKVLIRKQARILSKNETTQYSELKPEKIKVPL